MSTQTHRWARGRFLVFLLRLAGAGLAFTLALPFLSQGFNERVWPDYFGYFVGLVAAGFLAYALSLFGQTGGRLLIVGALFMLAWALSFPQDFGFFRSSVQAQILCYLVAGVCDVCGLVLVWLSGSGEEPPMTRITVANHF